MKLYPLVVEIPINIIFLLQMSFKPKLQHIFIAYVIHNEVLPFILFQIVHKLISLLALLNTGYIVN